ncbi:hypothetical protein ACIQW5_26485 [Methylorubrum thiocyanatum]|uniref:hypothetical protein n=1 Tax=Methylorubrum thiocyanatum TaxID=47958 RepID=UPI00383B7BD8
MTALKRTLQALALVALAVLCWAVGVATGVALVARQEGVAAAPAQRPQPRWERSI